MRFKLFFKRKSVSECNTPEDDGVANTPDAVFRVMKATMLIQKWYRRYKARLEARRQYTWNIFTQLEYASEQDQLRLYDFFSEVITSMESTALRNSLLHGMRPTEASLSEEDAHIRAVANVDAITVENSYKGYRIQWPLGRDQLAGMINSFKDKQTLHAKFVIEILLQVREQLKRMPNVNHVSSGMYSDVTLCGDLHGQLEDLLMIFYKNGLPSSSNCYIFNGDLVDRGSRSVEVSMVVFVCFLLYPNAVFFNRGNHEDHIVNCRYGFIKEVTSKYKGYATRILTIYKDIFSWLPLASIIDKRVMAMHGGCSDTLDLNMIERLDRHKYLSALKPSNLEEIESILSNTNCANTSPEIMEWKQILDLLWSDPRPQRGCHPNTHRGGGTYWGPDVSESILVKVCSLQC